MARLTSDDFCSVQEFWANYCWLIDEGESAEWASLWAEEGTFTGVALEPLVGHDSLLGFAKGVYSGNGDGNIRHMAGNLTCEYGESRDVVKARFYNHVTMWGGQPGAGSYVMALCEAILLRSGEDWQLKSNTVRSLTP
ncbi:MAG: nuclear transport factor 2 family protein [Novosphingobium sp.]|nr:nuclear transport factor 2 family protein [Novosphingobium sp.]